MYSETAICFGRFHAIFPTIFPAHKWIMWASQLFFSTYSSLATHPPQFTQNFFFFASYQIVLQFLQIKLFAENLTEFAVVLNQPKSFQKAFQKKVLVAVAFRMLFLTDICSLMYQYVWNESISGTWVTRSRIQMGDGSKFVSFIKKQTRPVW